MDGLSGEDGKTVVVFESLKRSDGSEVNQLDEIMRFGEKRGFGSLTLENMIKKDLPDGKVKIVGTLFDHLFRYDSFKPRYVQLGFLKEDD